MPLASVNPQPLPWATTFTSAGACGAWLSARATPAAANETAAIAITKLRMDRSFPAAVDSVPPRVFRREIGAKNFRRGGIAFAVMTPPAYQRGQPSRYLQFA